MSQEAPTPVTTDHGRGVSGSRGDPTVGRGDAIGRYLVLDRIAGGGMGVVYRAYDPELDRKVAIKVLRPGDDKGDDARTRLLREAQALAKLTHPNVVGVYDVGTRADAVFVAMELVEGQNLAGWLASQPRARADVLAVFVRAGRGLAAAHHAGLCHRDVKPSNILVAQDGAIKVADFGLARPAQRDPPAADARMRDRLEVAAADDPLTRSGAAAGTPAYMAPEVHLGELADARADQYSLCVALYEALVGRPPFTGHGEAELMQRKLGGAPEVPRTIPRRLRQTIARGLSPASADRFDSMDALVHALQQAGASRRRTTVLAFTVMAVASLWWFAREPEPSPCQRAQQRWQGIWDAATQQTVRSALLATEVPYAPEIVTEVEAGLDRYREQWVRIYTEACEATLVRGEQSQALFEVRSLCLEQRLGEARAVVALLQQADQTVVERSASAVAGLRPLERCGSGAALLTQMEPPSEPSAMEPIREQLAEVAALEWAGKYDEGLARAESVISAAEASEYAPALAEAYLRKGRMLERRGDYDEAVTWLSEAHWLAEGHRHEEVAAEAAALLVFVIGAVQGKFDEAVAWGRHAEASVRRVGLGGREEAELLNNLGTTHTARGEYKAGLDLFQRALVLKRAVWGADHHQVAIQLGNVGIALEELQRYDEAEAAYRESLSLTENTLGARHPQAAIAVGNLAGLAQVRGEFERAHSLFARALAIKQETLAPHHASLGYTYDGLGMAARNLGRFADAVLHHQRAVAIFTAALGPDHPGVATSLNNLGSALRRLGQLDEAHEAFERARRIWTARMGGEHRYNAVALTNLGLVAEARGDLSEALRYHQEARTIERAQDNPDPTHQAQLAVNLGRLLHQRGNDARAAELYAEALGVLESTWPEGHPEIASVLDAQGELALAQGRIEPALHILERAFEIREDHPDAPLEWGNTAFIYAKALEHAGDAEAAHRLATRTLARMEQTQVGPAELREIRQWLDARK